MASALISALTGRLLREDIAMTGEITIRGRVLEIGGLKEKSLAALRAGVKMVIIPSENKKDIDELPQVVRDGISFICADSMDKVIKYAFEKPVTVKQEIKNETENDSACDRRCAPGADFDRAAGGSGSVEFICSARLNDRISQSRPSPRKRLTRS